MGGERERGGETSVLRKRQKDELSNLYYARIITRVNTCRRATWTARVERTGYENRTDNSCQKSSKDETTKAFRNPAPRWEDSDKSIFQQNYK